MINFTHECELAARKLIDLALAEDLGPTGDRTSLALIPDDQIATANFVVRTGGVISGLPVAKIVCESFAGVKFKAIHKDGEIVGPKTIIAQMTGKLQSILIAERTALNFMQRLSGIASVTKKYVVAIAGTKAVVLDTRKTTPGWRLLEKYAVRCGGGTNHRIGLYDSILIKDNHIAGLGSVKKAVEKARSYPGNAGLPVEVEVDSLAQLDEVLPVKPEIVLLDNMSPALMTEAVKKRDAVSPTTKLEASGGINLTTIRAAAESGVDRISVGSITHSVTALDIALDYSA
jgi:nicotinate-nucleotide pyrophosphorylase (carboxylating)